MNARSSLLSFFVLAAFVAGCPEPTGRVRGPVDLDAAMNTCPGRSFPQSNQPCDRGGLSCSYREPCSSSSPGRLVDRLVQCQCFGSTWSCSATPCVVANEDASVASCPSQPVRHGATCSVSQGGLTCPGFGTACDGTALNVPCFCGGTSWFCQQPTCTDGGEDVVFFETRPPDVQDAELPTDADLRCPAMPNPGGLCMGNFVCSYPSGPGCFLDCQCDTRNSFFSCRGRCDSMDAGRD